MRGQQAFFGTGAGTWLVAMLVLAWIMASAGYTFLAFLALVLGFILLVGGLFAPSSRGVPGTPSGGGEGPIIIGGGGGPAYPSGTTFRFQPDWGGPSSGEESVGRRLGGMANFIGGTIGGLMGGKPELKDR